MQRTLTLLYGTVMYLAFSVACMSFIGFVGNLTPVAIDSRLQEPLGPALLVNHGPVAMFALQHTIMAQTLQALCHAVYLAGV